MSSWAEVRAIALAFPGVVEGTSYGTPAFRVGKAFLARLHEDGVSLVMKLGFDEREILLEAAPEVFHLTDHYRPHPFVLVRFAACDPAELRHLLERSWRALAPKRVVAAYDAGAGQVSSPRRPRT